MPDCTLWFGDCLRVLADASVVKPASVDLIYLDPPFNSKRDYNIVHGTGTQETMFTDTWSWGEIQESGLRYMERQDPTLSRDIRGFLKLIEFSPSLQAYLAFMAPRLLACKNVLKPNGSIYLHCDPNASHYLKPIMDFIFGFRSFSDEIIWKSSYGSRNDAARPGRGHDTILFYALQDAYFEPQTTGDANRTAEAWYRCVDEDGRRYIVDSLVAPGGNGHEYEFFGHTRVWRYPLEHMQALLQEGRIVYQSTDEGSEQDVPGIKRYYDENEGRVPNDLWDDIPPLGRSKERLNYPTQKPLRLLDRIIRQSSRLGDLVLDPFCGCGTAAEAAVNLDRNFIGIDVAPKAVELMRWRVREKCGIEPVVHGLPYDYESAVALARPARADLHRASRDFERWAIERIPGAQPNIKQVSDRGIDGMAIVEIPGVTARNRPSFGFQVKSGRNVGRPDADAFRGALDLQGHDAGLLIVLEESRARSIRRGIGLQEPVTIGNWRGPKVGVWSIQEHFAGAQPDLPPLVGSAETQALMSAREWQTKM